MRQNPPLAGDLLEEFRAGRSSGWFWRQTVVVILTGFASNARRSRRLLAARLIGWAAATGIAFGLQRLHSPLVDGAIALSSVMVLLLAWLWASTGRRRRRQKSDAETLEEWNQLDENAWRAAQRVLMGLFAGGWFFVCLMIYSGIALFSILAGPMPLPVLILFGVECLVLAVSDILAPTDRNASISKTLLEREEP